MAKDERGDRQPANDNGAGSGITTDPEKIRAALVPLVKLLARQAAREWYETAANDNSQTQDKERPDLERP